MSANTGAKPRSLLVISSKAGSLTPEIVGQIELAFPRVPRVEFDPGVDYSKEVAPDGRIIVAGGDGTIGFVVRQVVGTRIALGLLSFGTFNNFARSLGLDATDPVKAIERVRDGRPRAVTLGSVNGEIFLEAAAIGLFGQAIQLGEAAKDRTFGKLGQEIRDVAGAKPFDFRLRGDIEGSGRAMSLVFANIHSIGARVEVGDGSPIKPYLELSVMVGKSRTDVVGRVLAAAIPGDQGESQKMTFRFRRLVVETQPRIPVYADNQKVSRTPVTVEARVRVLRVIVPPGAGVLEAAAAKGSRKRGQ